MPIISFSISSSPPSRLDKALSRDAPAQAGLSRTRLTRLITEGYVEVDGNIVKNPNANVSEGQSIKVLMPELEPVETLPQKIKLDIIFEDEIVIPITIEIMNLEKIFKLFSRWRAWLFTRLLVRQKIR